MVTSSKSIKTQKKSVPLTRYDPTTYPLTWLRVVRLFVQFIVLIVFSGALFGLAVTWLTLPVQAPPSPWSISQGTIYIFQLLVVNAIFPFIPLATFFLFGGIFGRFLCGWACPFGLIQELEALIPVKKIYPTKKTNESASEIAQFFAGALIILVAFIGISRVLGPPEVDNQLSSTFGIIAIDPLTALDPVATLLTFIPYILIGEPNLIIENIRSLDIWFWFRITVLLIVIIIPIFIPRAYCRYICPTGAIMGRFGKHSILGIVRNPTICNIDNCNNCESICPMGVRILEYPDRIRDSMCIGCLDCAYSCQEGAIQLKIDL
ncbi:MAG: 4Fe-4S binding protein [Candidatus Hodarchaeales archaeon]|jgi:polyferredoxin